MAVSILLAAKENGLSSSDAQDIVRNFLDAYLNKMSDFKGTNDELSYRLQQSNTNGVVKDLIQQAAGKSRSSLLNKYTLLNSSSNRVFQTTSELQPVSSSTYSDITGAMSSYITSIPSSKRYSNSYYTLKDIRLKLGSGTGSLGKYRYYLLIEGPSSATDDDVYQFVAPDDERDSIFRQWLNRDEALNRESVSGSNNIEFPTLIAGTISDDIPQTLNQVESPATHGWKGLRLKMRLGLDSVSKFYQQLVSQVGFSVGVADGSLTGMGIWASGRSGLSLEAGVPLWCAIG